MAKNHKILNLLLNSMNKHFSKPKKGDISNILEDPLKNCSVCGYALTDPIISYPELPLTGIHASKADPSFIRGIDLNFHICENCGHGQLSNIVKQTSLYADRYYFRSSLSASSKSGIKVFLELVKKLTEGKRLGCVLEVGCNDLFLLNQLESNADKLFGIDPILNDEKILSQNSDGKIKCIAKMLEDVDLQSELGCSPDLVVATHTLEHVVDPKKFLKKMIDVGDEKTLFIFEVPGLISLLTRGRFDQIFHQHIQYFTPQSFKYLLKELGCELVTIEENYLHWGAMQVAFKKGKPEGKEDKAALSIVDFKEKILKQYEIFKGQCQKTREYLEVCEGKLYGYGAGLMMPVLFYHLGITPDIIDTIIDDDPNKKGLSYINLGVNITTPDEICNFKDSTIFVTAVDNARAILKRVSDLEPKHIVTPFNSF